MVTQTKYQGTERPVVDKEVAVRVKQYADKRGITNRKAYRQLITSVLDEEGNLKEHHTGAE